MELLVDLKGRNGDNRVILAIIDNTFNSFQLYPFEENTQKWEKAIGNTREAAWYNRKAHSKDILKKVNALVINEKAANNMDSLIHNWLQ